MTELPIMSLPHQVPLYRSVAFSEKRRPYALVIPVLNEGERISKQLERFRSSSEVVDIVIVDGGSTDHSLESLDFPALAVSALLTKIAPGGLSSQLRCAFDYCLTRGYEGILTVDGNNKDDVNGVQPITELLSLGYDFVQGSRFIKGGRAINTPFSRWWAIRLLHAPLTSVGARFWFTDSTNGFRGHSKRFLEDPTVQPFRDVFTHYELLAYLPIIAGRQGFRVCESPVTRKYPSSQVIPTKIHGLRARLSLLQVLVRVLLGRYSPK